mmetsp:Transcript_25228/g.81624  ORF Transcript_25228/g.81624 Transcript_25228/m.81624 type:complete len:217 (-) Transcript_25228:450-1100(-)
MCQTLDRVASLHILVNLPADPLVCVAQTLSQAHTRRPPQHLLDESVVRIAASHALWPWNVLDWNLLPSDLHHHLSHSIHRDLLVGANVQRLLVVRYHEPEDALNGVIDVAERARLLPVAPHFKFCGRGHALAAEGSRCLLATAFPRAKGTIDVVEAADACLHAEVGVVVHQQLLSHELLQAVGVLRLRRPSVILFEAAGAVQILVDLLVLRVDAGR